MQGGDQHREDEHEGDGVEDALGHQRAEAVGGRRPGLARAQHRLQDITGTRGQCVVAHVADDRDRVCVGPREVGPGVAQEPQPALAAQRGGQRVERERRRQARQRHRGRRQRGQLLARGPPDDGRHRDRRDDRGDQQGSTARGHYARSGASASLIDGVTGTFL